MRYNAKELRYEQVEVFGQRALFTEERLIKDSVPERFSVYEVRHDDDGMGYPAEIARGILVNFYGTLLVEDSLPKVDEDGRIVVEEEDWGYIGERTCTLEEYLFAGK